MTTTQHTPYDDLVAKAAADVGSPVYGRYLDECLALRKGYLRAKAEDAPLLEAAKAAYLWLITEDHSLYENETHSNRCDVFKGGSCHCVQAMLQSAIAQADGKEGEA